MPAQTLTDQPQPGTVGGAISSKRSRPATEAFRFVVARHDKVLEYQFTLARWVLASLLLANGAALAAVLNAADKISGVTNGSSAFVVGVAAALTCGVLAWLNCNLITIAADYRLDWAVLDVQDSRTADRLETCAWGLAIAALIAGCVSLAAFPIGVIQVQRAVEASKVVGLTTQGPVFTDEQMRILEKVGIAKPAQ